MYLVYCAVFAVLAIKANGWCCDQPVGFDAKLAKIVATNNPDNDKTVTRHDFEQDLNTNYDKNKDGKTSKMEWVLTRECLFGDSYGYGEWSFAYLDENKDGFITHHDLVTIGLPVISVDAFETAVKARYHNYDKTQGTVVG